MLAGARVIDLSQPLTPATPPWPIGGRHLVAEVTADYATEGAYARRLSFDEHFGTHFDAPAHFAPDGARIEGVAADTLVRPAVVVDARGACAADPDHRLSAAELLAHEAAHGQLPAGSCVLVMTGWDRHLDDPARYVGDLRFPGLAVDAGRLLVERGVAGIGIDTLGIDPGCEPGCPVHHVTLPAGLWHLEGLVGLERLPVTGAWIVVGVPLYVGGSGAPARVIALAP